jgi:cytosine permease
LNGAFSSKLETACDDEHSLNIGWAMKEQFRQWWTLDVAKESQGADNPLAPLTPEQRRHTLPLLTLAFGWGFLVTGLLTGGALGKGLPFWPDLVFASFLGNFMNFIIGGLVGYIGFKTACNSGLLCRFAYGNIGAYLPVLFIALLTIGWQGIVVGAFGFAWAQSFDSLMFYAIALLAGLLYTATTYFGVAALEKVSLPSVLILVAVGIYAAWLNITQAGGWAEFLILSARKSAEDPLTMKDAINLVVGSWIVGAIVMAEYTRFARNAWVALAVPFIVLIVLIRVGYLPALRVAPVFPSGWWCPPRTAAASTTSGPSHSTLSPTATCGLCPWAAGQFYLLTTARHQAGTGPGCRSRIAIRFQCG